MSAVANVDPGQVAPYPGSFHPSARGQQKLGDLIVQEIQQAPPAAPGSG